MSSSSVCHVYRVLEVVVDRFRYTPYGCHGRTAHASALRLFCYLSQGKGATKEAPCLAFEGEKRRTNVVAGIGTAAECAQKRDAPLVSVVMGHGRDIFKGRERARGPHLFLIFVRLFAPTTPPLFRAGISTQAQGPIARQPGLSDAKRALPSLTAPPSDPTPRATHNRRPLQTLVTFCAPTHEPSRFSPQTTTTTTTPRAPPPPYPSSPERLPFGLDFFGFSL